MVPTYRFCLSFPLSLMIVFLLPFLLLFLNLKMHILFVQLLPVFVEGYPRRAGILKVSPLACLEAVSDIKKCWSLLTSGNQIPISSSEDVFKSQFSLKTIRQRSQYLILWSPFSFIPGKISYYSLTVIAILVWGYALWGFSTVWG